MITGVAIDVGHQHTRAFFNEFPGNACPKTGASAGHDCGFSCQSHGVSMGTDARDSQKIVTQAVIWARARSLGLVSRDAWLLWFCK